MNLLLKLISSPWFWVDMALSVSGGVLVAVGLWIEKRAEKHLPPTDFNKDIFEDVIQSQKSRLERGWRILMAGIVLEVVAAFGISVISGLEIAETKERVGEANRLAAESNERSKQMEGDNLVLKSNLVALALRMQPRNITVKQKTNFISMCSGLPKFPVKVIVGIEDNETEVFAQQVREMLDAAGFDCKRDGILRDATLMTTSPIGTLDGFFITSDICLVKNDPELIVNTGQAVVIPGVVYVTNALGEIRCTVSTSSLNQIGVVHVIGSYFKQVGFNATWMKPNLSQYLKLGEGAVFIPQRPSR